jgi:hypothetical protein
MQLVISILITSLFAGAIHAQQFSSLNANRPIVDAHNCYPYDGRWKDRIDRALQTGFPVGIEQDMAWYVDPSGNGHAVVTHSAKTNAADPELRAYFFERVRPIIEKALADNNRAQWPLIILHFDFKDNQAPLLHAVWDVLGQYQSWITTALKGTDPHKLADLDIKPLLVLTEDSDAQEEVFFNQIPVGAKLRLFGSAHTSNLDGKKGQEWNHLAATLPPDQLLTERPTNYRRWWNNSWYEVEEGGQPKAGAWIPTDDKRLHALVDHAHQWGYWIRFYTLDGFPAPEGKTEGWFSGYNFGSLEAAQIRWRAAVAAGVNLIASDQYEQLSAVVPKRKGLGYEPTGEGGTR